MTRNSDTNPKYLLVIEMLCITLETSTYDNHNKMNDSKNNLSRSMKHSFQGQCKRM